MLDLTTGAAKVPDRLRGGGPQPTPPGFTSADSALAGAVQGRPPAGGAKEEAEVSGRAPAAGAEEEAAVPDRPAAG